MLFSVITMSRRFSSQTAATPKTPLIKRGNALVADDFTCVRQDVANNTLFASASSATRNYMEIHDAVRPIVKQRAQPIDPLALVKAEEVRLLGLADHLYAVFRKVSEKAGEGQPRTVHHRFHDRMIQTGIDDNGKLKAITPRFDELPKREARSRTVAVLDCRTHAPTFLPFGQLRTDPFRAANSDASF